MDKKNINISAFKAGLWYTICNVLIRGVNFMTTPLFTRLMSKEDFGLYSNYIAWVSILGTLTTLDLVVTVSRARFDYEDNLDEYISSIQVLGSLFTAICYLVICFFSKFFVSYLGMEMVYIHIMFLYLLVSPSLQLLQAKHQQLMKYKAVTALTISSTLLTVICSVVLVSVMNDKFMARVLGNTVVLLAVCMVLYTYNLKLGRKVDPHVWKYALGIAVPYIPHILAGNVLGTIDRIYITKYCGPESTALYSVVHTISLLVTMLGTSINQAWAPWLFENLNTKQYPIIRKATNVYIAAALLFVTLSILFGPEIISLFAGSEYREGICIVAPIMTGSYFFILYTFFVNIETFYKKTGIISICTTVSSIFNIITNKIFVFRFGYVAAAYTTLASYLLLFFLHFTVCMKLGVKEYYSSSLFVSLILIALAVTFISGVLYDATIIRFIVIGILLIGIMFFLVRKRNVLLVKIKSLVK